MPRPSSPMRVHSGILAIMGVSILTRQRTVHGQDFEWIFFRQDLQDWVNMSIIPIKRITFIYIAMFCTLAPQLLAQDGEVIGSRNDLQLVLDAYDKLRMSFDSYDASVICNSDHENGALHTGQVEISKRGPLYYVVFRSQAAVDGRDGVTDYFLDASRFYIEKVDSRQGIIRVSHPTKPVLGLYKWIPMTSGFPSPIDIDSFCFGYGDPFDSLIDPDKMKGKLRQIIVEKNFSGNIVLTRKYPSGYIIEAIASVESGYLLTSLRDVVQPNDNRSMQSAEYSWQKLENGEFAPKSKKYSHQFPKNPQRYEWEVTKLTFPSARTDFKMPSQNPQVGWKIIDTATKSEKVIGGEEGKRIRSLLDSVKRVDAEQIRAK